MKRKLPKAPSTNPLPRNCKQLKSADHFPTPLPLPVRLKLKGYSSGQSHFSEINAKLAEENKFVTHFVQKCLKTRENEKNVVLNESSGALGNRSEIVRILVLSMTTADDGVGRSNSV